jgi:predicted transposase/invertase (TIGR01784 family)
MTPEEKAVYIRNSANEMNYKSQLYTAEIKGRMAEKAEIARELKSDGMPIEKVARFTGLTIEEIESL